MSPSLKTEKDWHGSFICFNIRIWNILTCRFFFSVSCSTVVTSSQHLFLSRFTNPSPSRLSDWDQSESRIRSLESPLGCGHASVVGVPFAGGQPHSKPGSLASFVSVTVVIWTRIVWNFSGNRHGPWREQDWVIYFKLFYLPKVITLLELWVLRFFTPHWQSIDKIKITSIKKILLQVWTFSGAYAYTI